MAPTDELTRNKWISVLTSMGIKPSSGQAPQFDYDNWHFAVSNVRNYTGLDIRYGTKEQTKVWQPRLQDFMGEYHGPRDQAKGWTYFRRTRPDRSELQKLFKDLSAYEESSNFRVGPVVPKGSGLPRERALSVPSTIAQSRHIVSVAPTIPFRTEPELEAAIFQHKRDMIRDLGISLIGHHFERPDNRRSKIDLVGIRNSTGALVLIELKLRPLAEAVHEVGAYLTHWKELYPQHHVEGVYLMPNSISEGALKRALDDAIQFQKTRRLHIEVVSFKLIQGLFRYQAHGPSV